MNQWHYVELHYSVSCALVTEFIYSHHVHFAHDVFNDKWNVLYSFCTSDFVFDPVAYSQKMHASTIVDLSLFFLLFESSANESYMWLPFCCSTHKWFIIFYYYSWGFCVLVALWIELKYIPFGWNKMLRRIYVKSCTERFDLHFLECSYVSLSLLCYYEMQRKITMKKNLKCLWTNVKLVGWRQI